MFLSVSCCGSQIGTVSSVKLSVQNQGCNEAMWPAQITLANAARHPVWIHCMFDFELISVYSLHIQKPFTSPIFLEECQHDVVMLPPYRVITSSEKAWI